MARLRRSACDTNPSPQKAELGAARVAESVVGGSSCSCSNSKFRIPGVRPRPICHPRSRESAKPIAVQPCSKRRSYYDSLNFGATVRRLCCGENGLAFLAVFLIGRGLDDLLLLAATLIDVINCRHLLSACRLVSASSRTTSGEKRMG